MRTYEAVGGRLTDRNGVAYPVMQVPNFTPCTAYGDIPNNGMFGMYLSRKLSDVTDGLSNTLAIGEFVQKDDNRTNRWPLNVRDWIFGGDTSCGNMSVKVLVYPINSVMNRGATYVPYILADGSYHPGGSWFVWVIRVCDFWPKTSTWKPTGPGELWW